MERLKDISVIGAVLVFLFAVFYLLTGMVIAVTTDSTCLKKGYRSSSVDIFFNRYCITRTDQTDIVVPLEKARGEGE